MSLTLPSICLHPFNAAMLLSPTSLFLVLNPYCTTHLVCFPLSTSAAKAATCSGATLAEPLQPGQPAQMLGSVMIVGAETKEEVLEFLQSDIYVKGGAWNVEKATIIPVKHPSPSANFS